MKKLFGSIYTQILILAVLIVIFWYPILFNNEFFYDDWTFIDSIKSGHLTVWAMFKANNGHFGPIFNVIAFSMHKIFGLNIVPFMCLSIFIHIIICSLILILLRQIFKKKEFLCFLLTIFFALNTVYFEILHWFSALGQAPTLMALLLTLIFMNNAFSSNDKRAYYMSLFCSFFAPMHFIVGFLSIIFICFYYFLVLNQKFLRNFKDSLKFLLPYILIWIFYVIMYAILAVPQMVGKEATPLTFEISKIFMFMVVGFSGLLIKNIGFSPLVFPYTTGLAVFLMFFIIIISAIVLLYVALNKTKERQSIFEDKGAAWFAIIGMLLCYFILAVGRASLGIDSIANWGRYHYFTMFFLTILMGSFILQFLNIFSKIFNRNRMKILLFIIFAVFLLTHFMLIRQKSESLIRTEGYVPISESVKLPS